MAGAYSQLACDKLFKLPHIMYFASFEAVFAAIERGLCRYGVLPLENSTAGSVNAIYDLMMKHDFRIVRSVRAEGGPQSACEARHQAERHHGDLLPPAGLEPVRAVSAGLPGVKIIPCENTAVAAQKVAGGGRPRRRRPPAPA